MSSIFEALVWLALFFTLIAMGDRHHHEPQTHQHFTSSGGRSYAPYPQSGTGDDR